MNLAILYTIIQDMRNNNFLNNQTKMRKNTLFKKIINSNSKSDIFAKT